jgi:hypothetical protein
MATGELVDKELTALTALVCRDTGTLEGFVAGYISPTLTKKDHVAWTALRSKAHPFTIKIAQLLARLGLKPIAAQVPVARSDLMRATAADLICTDRDGHLFLFEIKCGFAGYYKRHTPYRMRKPLQAFDDSPYNQHQLQLLITVRMFEHTYARRLRGAAVLRATEAGVVSYDADSKLWAMWPAIEHVFIVSIRTRAFRPPTAAPKKERAPKRKRERDATTKKPQRKRRGQRQDLM